MPGVTINIDDSGEDESIVDDNVIEEVAEINAETVEVISDNEITIAVIEAEKEVAIAEIEADARVAEAEALAIEPAQDQEIWTTLNLLISQQAETQAMLQTLLNPPLSSLVEVPPMAAEMLTPAESDLIPSDTADLTSSTGMEPIERSEEESPALLPPLVEVRGKPIIRLI